MLNKKYTLEEELLLKIMDDNPLTVAKLAQIKNNCSIMKDMNYMMFLMWLVKHNYTGSKLVETINVDFENSMLNFMAWVRRKMHHDYMTRKVYTQ